MRFVIRWLLVSRPGRKLYPSIHRAFHPGLTQPWRSRWGGCWLCNQVITHMMPPDVDNHYRDRSRIELAPPVTDDQGKIVRRGVVVNATVQRQLEEILAKDPKAHAALLEAMEKIAEHPEMES